MFLKIETKRWDRKLFSITMLPDDLIF